jgi:uncharacterized protein
MRIALSEVAVGRTYKWDAVLQDQDTAQLIDATLAEPLEVHVTHTTVEGVTYLRIVTNGKVYARCDLCGTDCIADAGCTVDEELTVDSDCYDPIEDCYDVDRLVDEAIVMSAPRKVLCKPDCKGLCPICGTNLNVAQCTCQQQKPKIGDNNPFGVLKDIFPTGGANNGSTKM